MGKRHRQETYDILGLENPALQHLQFLCICPHREPTAPIERSAEDPNGMVRSRTSPERDNCICQTGRTGMGPERLGHRLFLEHGPPHKGESSGGREEEKILWVHSPILRIISMLTNPSIST